MKNECDLKNVLTRFGLKITRTRLHVLKILEASPMALSHSEIINRIQGDNHFDKVTIYRTLHSFVQSGLVHKIATNERNWKYALYIDSYNRVSEGYNHAHFICEQCSRIYCLPVKARQTDPHTGKYGFTVKKYEYRLHGVCPDCH